MGVIGASKCSKSFLEKGLFFLSKGVEIKKDILKFFFPFGGVQFFSSLPAPRTRCTNTSLAGTQWVAARGSSEQPRQGGALVCSSIHRGLVPKLEELWPMER